MSRFSKLEFDLRPRSVEADTAAAIGTVPRTASDCLSAAIHAERRCAFEEALQWFTRCLREDRSRIPAWLGQVQMLIELGEYQEADLWSGKALELFKNNGDLLSGRAQALFRLKDISAATTATDTSLKSPGTSGYRWRVRGEIMLDRDAENARRCFERSINESDSDWFDRIQIARTYLYYDFPAAALPWADAAFRLEPSHGCVHLVRGICQQELGLDDDAACSFVAALERMPRLDEARTRLAHLADQSRTTRLIRRFKGCFRK